MQNTKRKFIQKLFNKIAPQYNLFNNIVSLGRHKKMKKNLAKKVASHLAGEKKGIILDICCGTGDIAFFLEEHTSGQKIIGLDFSEEMLKIAKKRKSDVKFILKDVLPLNYADNSVSAVTAGFGLRNLVDLDFGLQEIYRVLGKNGVFCSLDMGKITFPIAKQIFHFLFFYFVPKIGLLLTKKKIFHYFPESTINYPNAKEMKKKLEKVGFSDVKYQNYFLGACVAHFAKK
jgi:demethylmenaquinone methyltransferase/2-methoxy-6-polyprenyl-1,4-benzoquinol methylase